MNRHKYLRPEERSVLDMISAVQEEAELAAMLENLYSKSINLHKIWCCRPYIMRLSDETVKKSGPLQEMVVHLCIMEGRLDEARRRIESMPKDDFHRICAELSLPGLDWKRVQECIALVRKNGWGPLKSLSITAGRPSILNGMRDFSASWQIMAGREEASRRDLDVLYGEKSLGIYDISVAEALYQQDKCFDALVKIVGMIPFLMEKQCARVLFAALTQQVFIMVINGQTRSAKPMITSMRQHLHLAGQDEWIPNVDALEAWAAMYDGDYVHVNRWMQEDAPDEYADFCMLDLFRYMVKLRGYLIQDKSFAFISLAERLIPFLEGGMRWMDLCELQILTAVCKYGQRDDGYRHHLEAALVLAEKYRYDRLFADEGERVLRMLLAYQHVHGKGEYLARLIRLAQKTAALYPRYLKPQLPELPALTESELNVLRFLADGRSNADIADLLQVSVNTVKAHLKHIAVKLETENRHQAVRRAFELGILNTQDAAGDS